MKAKNTRLEMRDQDIQQLIDESIVDYKIDYEFTLERLIRGKIDHHDHEIFSSEGPRLDALRFYEAYC